MKKIIIILLSVLLLASCDISITNSKANDIESSQISSQEKVSSKQSSSSSYIESSTTSKSSSSSYIESSTTSKSSSTSKQSSSSTSSKQSSTTSKGSSTANISSSFDDLGYKVISISLTSTNVHESGIYDSLDEVGAYLYLYKKLPSNYFTKAYINEVKSEHTALNKKSIGGDPFYNNEKILPIKSSGSYTECDIDYTGGGRNSKRIVFCIRDNQFFYTSDHYKSFSILRFYYE